MTQGTIHGQVAALALGALAFAGVARGDGLELEVVVETELDGAVSRIDESVRVAGETVRAVAPRVAHAIFTHWTISTGQAFAARDAFGRAFDVASAKIYEKTVLCAHYVAAARDDDGDGIADGDELYWYGSTDVSPSSDTDGDGLTFAEELFGGTNPHLVEGRIRGGVLRAMTPVHFYDGRGYHPYVIRSNPEGTLFETETAFLEPGSNVTTVALSPLTSAFAYWTVNGVRQCDALGRALDSVTFTTGEDLVIEAVCAENSETREKLYWYGRANVSMDSDTDGDGRTFEEELAAGTNPLSAEETCPGGVIRGASEKVVYNPHGYMPYVIRSEPEGRLFPTIVGYAAESTNVVTPVCSPAVGGFACWTVGGVPQRDAFGRALDQVTLAVTAAGAEAVAVCGDGDEAAKLYWYGSTDVAMTSDTDGDGKTFAEELEAGTNPLLAEEMRPGGVIRGKTASEKVDLQAFEQVDGFTVGGANVALGGGGAVWPVVTDVNGDGLFDVIVAHEGGARAYVNVGAKGAPAFRESEELRVKSEEWWTATLSMNSTAKLAGMSFDVAPAGALSATVWGETLLVSDAEGRIWCYLSAPRGEGAAGTVFVLQHKVWGGSYAGFAEGLRLAAVDWDDDGDLDCLCGTADGRVFLLRDPDVGRPAGLVAEAGVESVNLSWNANAQSRVRGYNVYRADEKVKVEGEGERWSAIAAAELPNYRDVPEREGEYAYRVTALSRYYVAGNSEPRIVESEPSEPATVDFGTAQFAWRIVEEAGKVVAAQLIVRNSSGLGGELQLEVGYDPAVLTPTAAMFEAGAIAPEFSPSVTPAGAGRLVVSGSLGAVEPDQRGVFFTLRFARVAGGDLAAANLTVGEFAIESEGHATKIELGGTTDGGGGDVNGDGAVDQADVSRMTELIRKPADAVDPAALKAGDLNGDGRLDAKDLVLLKRKVAGK